MDPRERVAALFERRIRCRRRCRTVRVSIGSNAQTLDVDPLLSLARLEMARLLSSGLLPEWLMIRTGTKLVYLCSDVPVRFSLNPVYHFLFKKEVKISTIGISRATSLSMYSFIWRQTVSFLALVKTASSQISGIDAVSTSPDEDGRPECAVSNFTSIALGVANISSRSISISQPLTWTVALSGSPDNSNQSQSFHYRNYILGTPPSVHLSNFTSIHGCGLFFEGMTPLLSLGTDIYTSTGTCTDVLPTDCVSEVIKLAQTEGQKLQQGQNANDSSSLCDTLQQRMSSSPPGSCNVPTRRDWGTILARGGSPLIYPSFAFHSC